MSVVDEISRIEWQTTSIRPLKFKTVLCSLVGYSSHVWPYCTASCVSRVENRRLYLDEEAGCCNIIGCRLHYAKITSIRYLTDTPTCCAKSSLPCFTVSEGWSLLFRIRFAYRKFFNFRSLIGAKPNVQCASIVEETGSVMNLSLTFWLSIIRCH